MNKLLLAFLSVLTGLYASAQTPVVLNLSDAGQSHWVDSVFKKLSRKRKIQQLLFVRAHTNLGQRYEDSVAKVIKKEQLGGAVFFQGGPVRQAALTNRYQQLVRVPLLIAMDGEWGLGMRLDSTISYPYQMTLGAIQDNSLIYKMGQYVAYDFKRLGLHMNFAPDMDVNNNPNNPVINYRSFGDNKYNVAKKGIAYMQGMQSAGLLTTAKHFPGHGDTDVDSHFDLPQLNFNTARLDSLEEYPFKEAIKAGISGIMVAHMNIPALDTTKNLPSTLSRPVITGVLKDSLGFKGLVVSDAMGMKGVVKFFPKGEADVRAFIAGNDILELSENSKRAMKMIRKAIRKKQINEKELDERVKKVLTAKYQAGLNHYKPVDMNDLAADLNRPDSKALQQQLADKAITLLKGDNMLKAIDLKKKTALVCIGADNETEFQRELVKSFTNCRLFIISKDASPQMLQPALAEIKSFEQIIIGVHDSRLRPASKLDYSADLKNALIGMVAYPNTVVSVFANAYTIAGLAGIEKAGALLAAYQKDEFMQRAAAGVITGRIWAAGKLPVSINEKFKTGSGIIQQ